MSALCRQFGISRKTGYKWAHRYLAACELHDRSRRSESSPRAVAQGLEDAIVAVRRARPTWGPRKLRVMLARANPTVLLPSVSTIALIIQRNGLVVPRRRRRRRRGPRGSTPLAHAQAPNPVVHRLQGRLRARAGSLLSADRHGRVQPLSARLRGAGQHARGRRPARARAGLRRVWAAAGHPQRQRLAVCLGAPRSGTNSAPLIASATTTDFRYPDHFEVSRVRRTGRLAWNARTVFVSTALRHRLLGLEWTTRGRWDV